MKKNASVMVTLDPTTVFDAVDGLLLQQLAGVMRAASQWFWILPSRIELIGDDGWWCITPKKLEIQYPSCCSPYKRAAQGVNGYGRSWASLQMITQLCISCPMSSVSCLFPGDMPEWSLQLHGSQLLCAQSCKGWGDAEDQELLI